MSWWVMEQVSVNDDGTQSLVNVQCDNVSDLPSPNQTATTGYTIVRGSQAKVLATSENYILGGSGTWVKMEDGVKLDLTGYATEQYVDDGLADKIDTLVYSSGQAAQDDLINYTLNNGVKNLLDYIFSINGNTSARTSNGVTFTINPDKSISTSGTASANITSAWIQLNYTVPDYPVILSGCPTGGANNTYKIDILDQGPTGSVVAADYGNGVVINSSMFTDGTGLIRIRIEKNQNVDGLVFKPMIRRAEITDSTYVPYAPTNRELYEMILALQ